jgi:flagellar basal-body rod modification protein FlgD
VGAGGTLSMVAFELERETHVELLVFDIKRTPIRRLLGHALPPGRYSICWDGRDNEGIRQPSGIYFYEISLDDRVRTQQLLLLE